MSLLQEDLNNQKRARLSELLEKQTVRTNERFARMNEIYVAQSVKYANSGSFM